MTVAETGERAVWVSHDKHVGTSCDSRVSVHDPTTLACLGFWDLELGQGDCVSVHISPCAAFVSHGTLVSPVCGVCGVYEPVAGGLGQLLYKRSWVHTWLFNSGFNCCFALAVHDQTLEVLDALTGAVVFELQPAALCSLADARITAAAWSSQNPSQLLVTCTAGECLSSSILQF